MSLAPLWVGASPLTQSQWAGEEGPEKGLERGDEPQSGSVLPWTLTRFHALLPAGPPATGCHLAFAPLLPETLTPFSTSCQWRGTRV